MQSNLRATVVITTLLTATTAWADEPSSPVTLNDVLWWLPADTQTIIVANGPFPWGMPDDRVRVETDTERRFKELLAGSPTDGKPLFTPEQAGTVSLVLQGSRKFRSPEGIGMAPYEGATIIIFKKDLGAAVKQWHEFEEAAFGRRKPRIEQIAGFETLILHEKQFKNDWTFYIVQPRPSILIFATNRDYLIEVLNRMKQRANTRALPPTLPEWKYVESRSPVWALRHYDRNDAADDPTSPLAGDRMPANEPDDKAIGLVFQFDPAEGETAHVRYLSSHPDALDIARRGWFYPDDHLTPRFRVGPEGVVHIDVPLKSADELRARDMFILVLWCALGHAAYL